MFNKNMKYILNNGNSYDLSPELGLPEEVFLDPNGDMYVDLFAYAKTLFTNSDNELDIEMIILN